MNLKISLVVVERRVLVVKKIQETYQELEDEEMLVVIGSSLSLNLFN